MSDNDVLIQIRGDVSDINAKLADLKGYIGKISDENKKASDSGTAFLQKLKQNWVEVAAAAYAAKRAFDTAMEYVELGAKAQQAEESFRLVSKASKENADQIVADMKRASAGTVDDSDIMQEAVKGMILGLKGDQLVKIMEVARVTARYAGVDVKTAYEDITNAIGTKMPANLVRYGLILKEEAFKIKQAMKNGEEGFDFYNLAMARADVNIAKFGEINKNAAEMVQEHKAQVNDLKESIGTELIDVLGRAVEALKKYKEGLIDILANTEGASLLKTGMTFPATVASYALSIAVRLSAAIKDAQGKTEEAKKIRAMLDKPIDASKGDDDQTDAEDNLKKEQAKLEAARLSDASRVAIGKSALEAMKAANKIYFEDQDRLMKHNTEMAKLESGNELIEAQKVINQKYSLIAEYEDRTTQEINKEADARSKEDKKKLSSAQFIADKTKALYAEVNKRLEENLFSQEELNKKISLSNLAALNSYAAWDQDTQQKITENARKQYGERQAISEEAWDAIVEYNRLTGEKTKETDANTLNEMIREYKETYVGGTMAGLLDITEAYKNVGASMENATRKAFDGMTDALTDFVMTGKLDFASLANAIIKDLIRIQIQSQITGPLSSSLGGFIKKMFGGSNVEMGQSYTGGIDYGFMHSGGIVGLEPSFARALSPSIFANAPRYHSGLAPDEFPTILQRGEGVFTKGQMQAMGSGNPSTIKVIINNTSSQKVEASKSEASFDSAGMVINIVLDAVQRNKMGLRDVLAGGR